MTGFVGDTKGDPVPGVVVSDGLSAQLTGIDGRFRLPGSGPFVWVCPPSEWTCSDWWLRSGRNSYDFVLTPAARGPRTRIAHISDLHLTLAPSSPAGVPLGRGALYSLAGAIRNSRADLVVATGDITDRGTVGELRGGIKVLGEVGVPFRLLPGNHDHYGHRFEPRPGEVPVNDAELGSATFTRWEEVVGPRWWSMNMGGLHLVALDWLSARTGADARRQMSWLAADLALLAPGRSVILLSHDQPDGRFFQALKRSAPFIRLVAVLSGHWHAPRAVAVNRTLHLSTGPALMAGRDWSSPQLRLVAWDGDRLESRIIVPAGASPSRFQSSTPRWSFETRVARSHSLHLTSHPDGVAAVTADRDRSTGTVAVLSAAGKLRWTWSSPQPIGSPAAVGPEGEVYVQTMAGTSARIDDGRLTWMIESPDPMATRVASAPLLTGQGGLLTEGPGFVRSLSCSNGRVSWTRFLGDATTHRVHGDGRMCDGLAVFSRNGTEGGLTVLDPATGSVVWGDGPGVPRPLSPPASLGDGTAIVVREGSVVERIDLSSGKVHWSTQLSGEAGRAAPVIIDELALVVTAHRKIVLLDSRTGWVLREHLLPGPAHKGAKTRDAGVAKAVLAVEGNLHVLTVAGEWWRLNPYHWEPELVATLPVAVVAQPVQVGRNLLIPGREGYLLAADLHTAAEHPVGLYSGPKETKSRSAELWLRSLKLPKR
ncbi:hypothetical protein BH23ACT12_BH23ACT12_01140 [soil metagenome]